MTLNDSEMVNVLGKWYAQCTHCMWLAIRLRLSLLKGVDEFVDGKLTLFTPSRWSLVFGLWSAEVGGGGRQEGGQEGGRERWPLSFSPPHRHTML